MEKRFIFGCGKYGIKALEYYGTDNIVAFIDNNENLQGAKICDKKIISLNEYINNNHSETIIIAVVACKAIEQQLKDKKIINIEYFYGRDTQISFADNIKHDNWLNVLQNKFNKKGLNVLEIGSRVVTGSNFRQYFNLANYIGFDFYPGENVDIVGDAHYLDKYFDIKFDLIFSSAVFEHLIAPWVITPKIAKLLKLGGHVFIETHYSYSSHERPWHFFQFSEEALKVLFSSELGFECLEAGVSNPINGRFSDDASEYLRGNIVNNLYCHSGYFGKKVREIENFSWENLNYQELVNHTKYPAK